MNAKHLSKPVAAMLMAFAAAAAGTPELLLDGRLEQGGLVVGRTVADARVTLDGKPVRTGPDGEFLLGFGRDAKPTAMLLIELPDGSTAAEPLRIARRSYQVQRIDGLPPKMVTPDPDQLARIRADVAAITRARRTDRAEVDFNSGWDWPLQGTITGVYGSQRILNGEPRRPHFGVDIAAPAGTPIHAPADGEVTLAHPDMYFSGKTLVLDHGHGLSTTYLHLQHITVAEGQRVRRGEIIGAVGATGRATGPHLCWRMNLFGTRLDPSSVVEPMAQPQQ